MQTAGEIRLQNLEYLIVEAGGAEALAARVESSPVYISQIRNKAIDRKSNKPRELGAKMARRLEAAFGKPHGWMDLPHPEASADAPLVREPVVSAYRPWPFPNISPERYARLPEIERGRVQGYVEKLLLDYEAGVSKKSDSG